MQNIFLCFVPTRPHPATIPDLADKRICGRQKQVRNKAQILVMSWCEQFWNCCSCQTTVKIFLAWHIICNFTSNQTMRLLLEIILRHDANGLCTDLYIKVQMPLMKQWCLDHGRGFESPTIDWWEILWLCFHPKNNVSKICMGTCEEISPKFIELKRSLFLPKRMVNDKIWFK